MKQAKDQALNMGKIYAFVMTISYVITTSTLDLIAAETTANPVAYQQDHQTGEIRPGAVSLRKYKHKSDFKVFINMHISFDRQFC